MEMGKHFWKVVSILIFKSKFEFTFIWVALELILQTASEEIAEFLKSLLRASAYPPNMVLYKIPMADS